MSKRHKKAPSAPSNNCGNCRYSAPIQDSVFREIYPDMEMQCDRQKYPGAVFFTNATILMRKEHSCYSWSPKEDSNG